MPWLGDPARRRAGQASCVAWPSSVPGLPWVMEPPSQRACSQDHGMWRRAHTCTHVHTHRCGPEALDTDSRNSRPPRRAMKPRSSSPDTLSAGCVPETPDSKCPGREALTWGPQHGPCLQLLGDTAWGAPRPASDPERGLCGGTAEGQEAARDGPLWRPASTPRLSGFSKKSVTRRVKTASFGNVHGPFRRRASV